MDESLARDQDDDSDDAVHSRGSIHDQDADPHADDLDHLRGEHDPEEVEDEWEDGNLLLVKGAAEVLVHRCSHYLVDSTSDTAEEVRVLSEEVREEVCRCIRRLQRQSLRCLALAYRVDNAPEIDQVRCAMSSIVRRNSFAIAIE